jgi:hypothetical protein
MAALTELVLRPLADAFMQVGVPVALLAAVAAWARVRWGSRLLDLFADRSRVGVLVGALLGVSPGCGGAILVVVLAARRRTTYGAAVAAVTATMGDSSWVILAADLEVALWVHAALLVAGLVTGYAVDAARFDPRTVPPTAPTAPTAPAAPAAPVPAPAPARAAMIMNDRPGCVPTNLHDHAMGGRPVALAGTGALTAPMPPSAALMWLVAALASVLAVPAAFQLVNPVELATALDGVDVWLLLGCSGALACLVVFVRSGCRLSDDTDPVGPVTLQRSLGHAAVETSFVVVWVAAAFVAQTVLMAWTGFDGSQLPLAGVAGIATAAAVGLVPGCGAQIAFTALYVTGAVPLPTLLTNAVAQDGDALLPLLALDRRAALVTTALTTVPAVLAGSLALLLL